jgi:hypothetical protein
MKQNRILCDACGKEIKDKVFIRVETMCIGDYPIMVNKNLPEDLDFCDDECLKNWANTGG